MPSLPWDEHDDENKNIIPKSASKARIFWGIQRAFSENVRNLYKTDEKTEKSCRGLEGHAGLIRCGADVRLCVGRAALFCVKK